MKPCPRCGDNVAEVSGVVSRHDYGTEICSMCRGEEDAIYLAKRDGRLTTVHHGALARELNFMQKLIEDYRTKATVGRLMDVME